MVVLETFIDIICFMIGILLAWVFIGVPVRVWRKKCNELKELEKNNTHLWNHNINLEARLMESNNIRVELSNQIYRLESKLREGKNVGSFSKDELTKMRFYLHPDRNNGKTGDLFVKINDLIERS